MNISINKLLGLEYAYKHSKIQIHLFTAHETESVLDINRTYIPAWAWRSYL